jgi:DNA polymerase
MEKEKKKKLLNKLEKEMEKDDSLPLKSKATNLVFGEGDPNAKIMFIGEGPGYWEDRKKRPFVGNAGILLNQLLASIKLPREEVFITNVVHHRPPGNRDPEEKELKAYGKYLDKIIEIIRPKVIITLGRFSMAKFLPGVKISRVHGKVHKVFVKGRQIIVVPMYHPAAGLRNTGIKRQLFEDFEKLPEVLAKAQEIEIEQIKLL